MIADLGDAIVARIARPRERDDVAGFDGDEARRKGELGAISCGPRLEEPAFGDLGRLIGFHDDRQFGERDAAAGADEAARFRDGAAVIAFGRGIGDPRRGRQIGFLRARQRGEVGAGAQLGELVGLQEEHGWVDAAMAENDPAFALDGVEEVGEFERLEGIARAT